MSKFKYSLTVLNTSVITGYLFLVVYDELGSGNLKEFKSHFSLKR